jgi:hypothetical protein
LGDRVEDRYIDQLIAEADFLKDGRISYSEFLHAFREQMENLVGSFRSSEKSLSNVSNMEMMLGLDNSESTEQLELGVK